MLYILRADIVDNSGKLIENTTRTKIGITKDYKTYKRRIQNIRTGCPFQITEWAVFPSEGIELENRIKKHFKGRFNKGTEWVIAEPIEIMQVIVGLLWKI